jgi:hypothetical protein
MKRLVGMILVALLTAGVSHAAPETSWRSKSYSTKPKAAEAKPKASTPKPVNTSKPAGAATARPAGGPRKLEDIHIEGEIPVPQVLFITARDQRRFLDFHHRRYLRTSRELGEATTLPSRVVILPGSVTSAEAAK